MNNHPETTFSFEHELRDEFWKCHEFHCLLAYMAKISYNRDVEREIVWEESYECTLVESFENEFGYRGIAYRVRARCVDITFGGNVKEVMVFAHRGTDCWRNLVSDLKYGIVGSVDLENAIEFIRSVTEEIDDGTVFVQAGHSLGALIAEGCADHFSHYSVTFDSPGSGNMVKNHDFATKNFVCYLSKQNLVNTWGKHLGSLRKLNIPTRDIEYDKSFTIFRRITDALVAVTYFASYFSSSTKETIYKSWVVTSSSSLLAQTIERHSIELIESHMGKYQEIDDWYANTFQYLKWEIENDLFSHDLTHLPLAHLITDLYAEIFKSQPTEKVERIPSNEISTEPTLTVQVLVDQALSVSEEILSSSTNLLIDSTLSLEFSSSHRIPIEVAS